MLKDFRDFVMRGNVLDLAVAVVIGAAFKQIVTSFVNDILMPPVGLLLGNADFSNLYLNLSGGKFASLAEAQAAGAATINYGVFINTLIDFLITAFAIFVVVRAASRLHAMRQQEPGAPPPPSVKTCPYCATEIPIQARRCPHCTSRLEE